MRRMTIALALAAMLLSPVPQARAQGSGANSQIDIRDFPTASCVWERRPLVVFFRANGDLYGPHVDMVMQHWNRVQQNILIEECAHSSDGSVEAVMERTRRLTASLVARGVSPSQIWTRSARPSVCNDDPGVPPNTAVNVEGRELACGIDVWNSQQEWWERNCLAPGADPRSTLCHATWEIIRGRWPSNVPAVTP